jgi:hypothetical protein
LHEHCNGHGDPTANHSFLPLTLGLAPRAPARRLHLIRDINSRALIFTNNHTSIILRLPVIRVDTTVCTSTDPALLSLALRFPTLHQPLNVRTSLLLTIPRVTATTAPAAHIVQTSSARWGLSVDEAAFGADQSEAILRLCLVFSEQGVEDTVVPVRLRERGHWGGGELLSGCISGTKRIRCEFGAGSIWRRKLWRRGSLWRRRVHGSTLRSDRLSLTVLWTLDVCRRWRSYACSWTWSLSLFLRTLWALLRRRRLFLLLGRCAIFLEQQLSRVEFRRFLQPLDGSVAVLIELLEELLRVRDAVVEVARERVADAVDAAKVRMVLCSVGISTHSTGPPATTVPSITPQFCQPVTSVSSSAARIYAKPAYSVHITRARLDSCRCRSLTAVALLILPVSVFSVFSNDAASSLACSLISNVCAACRSSHSPSKARD